jgi:hypothetical protein
VVETDSVTVLCTKVAVTFVAEFSVMLQPPVPVHAPDQPAKVDPRAALAASDTAVPDGKVALHALPQLMPADAADDAGSGACERHVQRGRRQEPILERGIESDVETSVRIVGAALQLLEPP